LVRFLQTKGLRAEKVSRTGYSGSDISLDLLGIERRVEVKVRSHGFTQLYEWLANSELLIIRADRKEPLVVLPLWLGAEVARVAEQATKGASPSKGNAPFVSHAIVGEA
jgi:hypothetical protein